MATNILLSSIPRELQEVVNTILTELDGRYGQQTAWIEDYYITYKPDLRGITSFTDQSVSIALPPDDEGMLIIIGLFVAEITRRMALRKCIVRVFIQTVFPVDTPLPLD